MTPLLKKPGDQGEKSEEKAISIFRAIFIPVSMFLVESDEEEFFGVYYLSLVVRRPVFGVSDQV